MTDFDFDEALAGDYLLYGYRCRENQRHFSDLEFPIDAYKVLCSELDLPWPFEDVNPLNTTEPLQHEHPQVTLKDENSIEIVEGVTVGDLRQYLDKDSEEFLPRLLALLVAKQRVIKERDSLDKDGMILHPRKTRKQWVEKLANEEYKKLFGCANDQDGKAISRCLMKDIKPITGQGGSY